MKQESSAGKAYRNFVRLMTEDRIYTDCCITFEAVCRMLAVAPESLDRTIRCELGMTGQQLVETLRRRWMLSGKRF